MDLLHQLPLHRLRRRFRGPLLETQHPPKLASREAPSHRLRRNSYICRQHVIILDPAHMGRSLVPLGLMAYTGSPDHRCRWTTRLRLLRVPLRRRPNHSSKGLPQPYRNGLFRWKHPARLDPVVYLVLSAAVLRGREGV